jgi:hypothetical protein
LDGVVGPLVGGDLESDGVEAVRDVGGEDTTGPFDSSVVDAVVFGVTEGF